jgi:phosphate transport system protein
MCMLTGALLAQATRSACQTDPAAAHWVVAGSDELDRQRGHAEELVVRLLAVQAPVATDLRRVVSALWIVGDVHRMGVLAIHVAQATLRRYPEPVLPVTVRPVFARMGRIGEQLAGHTAAALRLRDVVLAQGVSARDPEMDRLHRQLLAAALDPSWPYGVATTIDICQLGRFYDRFADHAAAAADRVIYQVTGHPRHADTA